MEWLKTVWNRLKQLFAPIQPDVTVQVVSNFDIKSNTIKVDYTYLVFNNGNLIKVELPNIADDAFKVAKEKNVG